MVIGSYPCCDGDLMIPIADDRDTPYFMRDVCPHCGTTNWHRISRLNPQSWTDEAFLKEYEADGQTVRKRDSEEGGSHA